MTDDDATRRRARAGLRSGAERAGARSHFRAMDIDPDRLDGPIVGIASTWTRTMPCNLNHRRLAARAAAAVEAAGGVALEFNTIAVSDNQTQGTPGMRASLVSREPSPTRSSSWPTRTTSTRSSASSGATRPCPAR